jgi:hypothetical protein
VFKPLKDLWDRHEWLHTIFPVFEIFAGVVLGIFVAISLVGIGRVIHWAARKVKLDHVVKGTQVYEHHPVSPVCGSLAELKYATNPDMLYQAYAVNLGSDVWFTYAMTPNHASWTVLTQKLGGSGDSMLFNKLVSTPVSLDP